MTPLTKKQIHLLAAYEFKLWDSVNKEKFEIKLVGNVYSEISNLMTTKIIESHKIGTRYKILSRPLSSLTEPMENGEVPIQELCKISLGGKGKLRKSGSVLFNGWIFEFDGENFSCYENIPWGDCNTTYNQQQLFDKLWSMHFCTFCPEDMQVDLRGV